MKDTLQRLLSGQDSTLTPEQLDTFERFGTLLLEKNKVMNLTAITEPEKVAELHFYDCLTLLRAADLAGKRVIDVGCGAGFPGVPLKIAEPSMELTLLDSLGKRMDWLREILPQLQIEADVVTARAEEYVSSCRESFDAAVSRAVARLSILAELCLPYVKPGGVFLAMKGQLAEVELNEARRAISLLGGKVERVCAYEVADAVHRVVVIRKCAKTPAGYPRAFAKIKKNPL